MGLADGQDNMARVLCFA